MSAIPLPKEEVIDRLAKVFRDEGYEAASLARLAQATGLGKASLYYHFPKGKEQMATAVVEQANSRFAELVIAPLQAPIKPATRIARMIRSIDDYYCHGQESCLLGVLAMSASPAIFHHYVKDGLLRWVNTLAAVLKEHGLPGRTALLRAEGAVCMVEGALVLTRGVGSTEPFSRTLGQLRSYLLAPA